MLGNIRVSASGCSATAARRVSCALKPPSTPGPCEAIVAREWRPIRCATRAFLGYLCVLRSPYTRASAVRCRFGWNGSNQMFRLELRLAADRFLLRSDRNKGSVATVRDSNLLKLAYRSCSSERGLPPSVVL